MKSFPVLSSPARAAILVIVAAYTMAPAAVGAESAVKQLFTCSMHPQILLDHPGDCPVCGMKLVPVVATTGAAKHRVLYYKSTMNPGEISQNPGKDSMGMDLVPVYEDAAEAAATLSVDPVTIQKMNLKTEAVRTGPVRRELRVVGTVDFNEQGLRDITTKYEGWIEKLFVSANWLPVRAGEPLLAIYSPDLYNAELNYLIAVRSEGTAGGPLTHAARERLRLYDVPNAFLEELAQTGEAARTYTYRAPADGVIIEKTAVEGMMVKAGERLFRLADLATVWVNAQIYENDLAFVRPDQPVRVRRTYGGEREFAGKVDLLLPAVEAASRTAQARIVLANPDLTLKPGMFVEVRLETELAPAAVLVPDTAVLRSGERNTVFVALPDGSFLPRAVKLGARTADGDDEVLAGLTAGERVVTSGQFLLDSESQLREAIQKMLK
ncbi:MAG TPA: efflux RND transporter periplasmic adaptor subunit [Opitutaceae bacterium]|nr:efflux RND transporter periplasmic adaptor subunit [Opitutaceae bacterium]